MKKASIEGLGVISSGEAEVVLRREENGNVVYYRAEKMSLDEHIEFLNSLMKIASTNSI